MLAKIKLILFYISKLYKQFVELDVILFTDLICRIEYYL
nr:hypothetical protein [Mucilaginibacter sp. X4EP1]